MGVIIENLCVVPPKNMRLGDVVDAELLNGKKVKAIVTRELLNNIFEGIVVSDDVPAPIFRATVDARGQITIPEGVRKARGIKPKDEVDVYELKKV